MARSTSSAEPDQLFRYADFATRLDHELISRSSRLTSRLQHFEAKCSEPGFQVRVSHLGDALRSYGNQSAPVDDWVRRVGKGFQTADWVWSSTSACGGTVIGAVWGLSGWTLALSVTTLRSLLNVPVWLAERLLAATWVRTRQGQVLSASLDLKDPLYGIEDAEYNSWRAVSEAESVLSQRTQDLQSRLEELRQQKQQLLGRRHELETELGRWYNKVVPDSSIELGFDDGLLDAPWRTKADALEDEIADIDTRSRQITEEFQSTKLELERTRSEYQQVVKLKEGWVLTSDNKADSAYQMNPKVKPENFDPKKGCALYAQNRRSDLGSTGAKDGGAAGYIETGKAKSYKETVGQSQDLRESIKPGFAVVWPRKHLKKGSPGYTYGHVAIIEKVGPGYVEISQAGWGTKYTVTLTTEELKSLYFVP